MTRAVAVGARRQRGGAGAAAQAEDVAVVQLQRQVAVGVGQAGQRQAVEADVADVVDVADGREITNTMAITTLVRASTKPGQKLVVLPPSMALPQGAAENTVASEPVRCATRNWLCASRGTHLRQIGPAVDQGQAEHQHAAIVAAEVFLTA